MKRGRRKNVNREASRDGSTGRLGLKLSWSGVSTHNTPSDATFPALLLLTVTRIVLLQSIVSCLLLCVFDDSDDDDNNDDEHNILELVPHPTPHPGRLSMAFRVPLAINCHHRHVVQCTRTAGNSTPRLRPSNVNISQDVSCPSLLPTVAHLSWLRAEDPFQWGSCRPTGSGPLTQDIQLSSHR